jgi:glycosyltransferase involved in cell wall biosynthesis
MRGDAILLRAIRPRVEWSRMRISLILATLGRASGLPRFLRSLREQTHADTELLVVDQNGDDRLLPLLDPYRDSLRIVHLRSLPGLSRARNAGLTQATGDLVAFPDDDCWYPDTLLADVMEELQRAGTDGLTCRVVDETETPIARFAGRSGHLTLCNLWTRVASVSLFVRTDAVRSVRGFDETLGLGSGTRWGAAEDFDLPIRLLRRGYRLFYSTGPRVLHPHSLAGGYGAAIPRAKAYAPAVGRVWRKHRYPLWFVAYGLLRPFGGILLGIAKLDPQRARYHLAVFRGRLSGWLWH